MGALETLREIDRHFQKLTQQDVPEQVREFKRLGDGYQFEDRRCEHYELWRRVRHAIKELEQEGSSCRTPASAASHT